MNFLRGFSLLPGDFCWLLGIWKRRNRKETLFIFFNPCAAKEMKCRVSYLASYSLASVCSRFGFKTHGTRRLFRWYRVKKKKKKKSAWIENWNFLQLVKGMFRRTEKFRSHFSQYGFLYFGGMIQQLPLEALFQILKYHLQVSLVSHNSVKTKIGNYWLAIKTARAAENIF